VAADASAAVPLAALRTTTPTDATLVFPATPFTAQPSAPTGADASAACTAAGTTANALTLPRSSVSAAGDAGSEAGKSDGMYCEAKTAAHDIGRTQLCNSRPLVFCTAEQNDG
jgi:hypothetical protein